MIRMSWVFNPKYNPQVLETVRIRAFDQPRDRFPAIIYKSQPALEYESGLKDYMLAIH